MAKETDADESLHKQLNSSHQPRLKNLLTTPIESGHRSSIHHMVCCAGDNSTWMPPVTVCTGTVPVPRIAVAVALDQPCRVSVIGGVYTMGGPSFHESVALV